MPIYYPPETDKKPAGSVSYQLIGRKSNPIFHPLEYLIERTVALIQVE